MTKLSKEKLYIIGHKNPDTDSICSAIAYTELKKRLGYAPVAVRSGEINRETEYVLNYFGVEAPEYLTTIRTRVADLNLDKATSINQNISIKNAWQLMKKNTLKFLPVVDEKDKLIGILTLTDIANKYMDPFGEEIIKSSKTSLKNIAETLNAEIIYGTEEQFETTGKVFVAAMSSKELDEYIGQGDIVIMGNRPSCQLEAINIGVSCIIVTGENQSISQEIIDEAKKKNCIIMLTDYDTFTCSRMINQSIPVAHIMTSKNLVKFYTNEFIDDVQEKMQKQRQKFYPVVDNKNKIIGILSRYNIISYNKKKMILVDHNSKSQAIDGIDDVDIVEIIDHHRIEEVKTAGPIYFRNEPLGSTATIIANLYFEHNIIPEKKIAGILCAAILSDTVIFRSPTCTMADKIIAKRLAELAGINIERFALDMFMYGSDLTGKTSQEIFYQDFKDFVIGKRKVGVAQIMSVNDEEVYKKEDELIAYMRKIAEDRNYYLIILMITNIVKGDSMCLFTGKGEKIIEDAFEGKKEEHRIHLKGVISRKKQVIPNLSSVLE